MLHYDTQHNDTSFILYRLLLFTTTASVIKLNVVALFKALGKLSALLKKIYQILPNSQWVPLFLRSAKLSHLNVTAFAF
jgi:hypothetical protein